MTLQHIPKDKIMAFFVGGPYNGATEFLDPDITECPKAKTNTIAKLVSLKDDEPNIPLRNLRIDMYRKTKEMSHLYYRGCYIFEWFGEQ